MKKKIATALFVFMQCFAVNSHATPAAGVSGALSIVPGLGQAANGDLLEGFGWLATSVVPFLSGEPIARQIGFDIWQYNMYDAYRDAKPGNKRFAENNVFENYIAFANPLNIVDPIGGPMVGYAAIAGRKGGYPSFRNPALPFMYGFVALGEEGLFRGFLFPAFTDVTGGRWGGAIISSTLFSYAHAIGGADNLKPLVLLERFGAGMIFCWQADRNKYDLRNNIFAHAWYDIFISDSGRINGGSVKFPIYF